MPINFHALGHALERLRAAERRKEIAEAGGEMLVNSMGSSVPVTYSAAVKTSKTNEFNQALAEAQAILADTKAPKKEVVA